MSRKSHAELPENATTISTTTEQVDAIETNLSERQQRELEYHREHADKNKHILNEPFNYDVIEESERRWWNQYWAMFTYLLDTDLSNKHVLVVGCGFGSDAINLAKAGAKVSAFDLSPESLEIAAALAEREGLEIDFQAMPAEKLNYPDDTFDIVVARDILHHVDIPDVVREIKRVAKQDGLLCFNEVYSHSIMHRIRYSRFIDKWLYPKMVSIIYSDGVYITDDEERLTEKEVSLLLSEMKEVETRKYFNAVVTRLVPDRFKLISKVDQLLLKYLPFIAPLLGSRVLVGAKIK